MPQIIENTQPTFNNQQLPGAQKLNLVPLKISYSFDYERFANPDLEGRAKNTLGNFLGFMRYTFDGFISIGQALQNFYIDCLTSCPDGKKVFDEWLDMDFGASKYVASSAMKFHGWFQNLHPRVQDLLRSRIQNWSISAISLLMKASEEILEELVSGGKKTAAQVKQFIVKKSGSASTKASSGKVSSITKPISQSTVDSSTSTSNDDLAQEYEQAPESLLFAPAQELVRGVRIIVQNDTRGYNNHSGIITDIGSNDDFWVLLDNTVAQGDVTKNLYTSNQLKPETQRIPTPKASAQTLTVADIEQIKAEAIRQYKLEHAESEQGRYLEIKGAAISDAKKEIASFEKHAQNMTDKVSMLVKQLEEKEQEIACLNSLHVENQQLQQRVTELENALLKASENSWGNTFNTQAQKVLNKDVEQKAALLLFEVEQLKASVKEKDTLIAQMQQASISDSDSIISEFGEIAETLGWNGWRRSGYRDKNGTLHKGMNAISAFVSDLTHEYQYY